MVVATKVYGRMGDKPNQSGLSRRHIMQQIKGSLKRLQMDHVDLYQIHRWDHATPIEETMRALDDLVHQGLTHYIGASSMWAWQFQRSLQTSQQLGLERFVSMQNHYNLAYREEEREMIPLCKEEGIALIPWSPLAKGFLTGKYRRGRKLKSYPLRERQAAPGTLLQNRKILTFREVVALANEKGVTAAQIALAWLLNKGVTAPIVGPTRVEHIEDAVAAVDVKLSTSDMNRLETKYKPHPVMGHE